MIAPHGKARLTLVFGLAVLTALSSFGCGGGNGSSGAGGGSGPGGPGGGTPPPPMGPFSNYLVHSVYAGFSGEACTATCILDIPVPSSSSANLLNVSLFWNYASTAPTITNVYCNSDTTHASWTWSDFGKDIDDTGDLVSGADYYVPNAASGCTVVHVKFDTAQVASLEAHYVELRQIATSSPLDVANSSVQATSPNGTPNALVTIASGDVIYVTCATTANGVGTYNSTNVTGTSGATVLVGDTTASIGAEAFVQTNSGSITPSMDLVGTTLGSGDNVGCMGVAFKTSAGTGTNPSGFDILQQFDYHTLNTTAGVPFTLVNSGDALVFAGLATQSPSAQWTSISDSLGNSLTTHDNADGNPAWAIDCDAASGQDFISLAGIPSAAGWVIQEVKGWNNSSHMACFDSTAGLAIGTGNAAPYTNAPAITPSTPSGVIEAFINEGTGPITGATSPTGVIYAFPTYTGQTDSSYMTMGGGFAYYVNGGTNSKSFAWSSPNSSSWNSSAIALLP